MHEDTRVRSHTQGIVVSDRQQLKGIPTTYMQSHPQVLPLLYILS